MSVRHGIECDGGPYCQAAEHIEGCFASAGPHRLVGEVERLQSQLAGAVDRLAEIERVFNQGWLPPIPGERGTLRLDAMRELRGLIPARREAVGE